MTDANDTPRATRRGLLGAGAGLMASAGVSLGAAARGTGQPNVTPAGAAEPFWGPHQAGIISPAQAHTYFAAFDLTTAKRTDVVAILQRWTAAAARMTAGLPAAEDAAARSDPPAPAGDSGDAAGLAASRLTITFGFGPGLFIKDGQDRYGLAGKRPAALIDLPKFSGDQLVESSTGGDLSIQACADDQQIAFHAVRQLARLAYDLVQIRWVQSGFLANPAAKGTPRNLMGFKDGTGNVRGAADTNAFVWVGAEGPAWMQGGSYLVTRRSRIALEHWDQTNVAFQEQTIGRHKLSGAPLGEKSEFDAVEFDKTDADGNPVIPENSHLSLANAANNDGARILRRSYSYNDGVNIVAERWPPWKQGMEYDAGLLFMCYQKDPRTGFVRIFERMSKFDMLNQFVTNVGGALFACPRGVAPGQFIGQGLFA